jgi:ATP-binding cassette subfamily F protein 3
MSDFPMMGEKAIFNHLGKFNFSDDDFFKTLDMLSGGEKMRLVLSKIILKEYDLLLLDEPTNHLDIITKQALIRALDDYEGTIIFVSHDRHFVDEISNKILYFHNGKSYYHDGNYQDFKELEKELFNMDEGVVSSTNKEVKETRPKEKNISLNKLEEKISKIEAKIEKLKKSQFDEEIYTNSVKMKEIDQEISTLEEELIKLSEEYLERA